MLTDTALRNLKPKSKTYKASDRDGMYVTVSPTGTVTFRYDYRLNGRRETLTIGRYGPAGISLAMAREKLLDAKKAVAQGKSPALEKQREKRRLTAAKTFGDMTAQVAGRCPDGRQHASDAQEHRRSGHPAGLPEPAAQRNHSRRPARLVQQGEGARAPATAVHIRDIVKQVYAFAILHGEKVDNPAAERGRGFDRDLRAEGSRLSPLEIRLMSRQMESVATYPTIKLALRMILLTLVRKSELIEATWDEVDFENATWTIPKQRMKGRNPHVVYLSRQALDIFVALHTCAAGSKFVLPSRYDADRCMSNATLNRVTQIVAERGQGRRPAAGAVHRPRPAPHRLDAAQRNRLQPRLDREVPGARGRAFLALGLQQGRVRRAAAPHAAGVGQHGRCLDRRADLRAEADAGRTWWCRR
jgi:integrase